jgi:hypothetical protein
MTGEQNHLDRRLERAARPDPPARERRPVQLVVGVDFGTTCTKIVARLPYEPGEPAFAVPAPRAIRAEDHPYLARSAVWLGADGVFGLIERAGADPFTGFKASLLGAFPAFGGVERPGPSAEELTTAYLTLQLRSAVGWLLLAHGDGALGKGELSWSWNFGFPAASLDDEALASRYRRCAAAALDLVRRGEPVTLELIRQTLASFSGEQAGLFLERQNAHLVPEVAAAVVGFAHSAEREDELFALVDVGGLTVDACTFNLVDRKSHGLRCGIFEARVEQLGVEAWKTCQREPNGPIQFEKKFDEMVRAVIWDTRVKRNPRSRRWRDGLPLFETGGGIASTMHRERIRALDQWLRDNSAQGGGVYVRSLPPAKSLVADLCRPDTLHRLAVAVGLSLPNVWVPEVWLPRHISDHQASPATPSCEDRYISKDHV